MQYKRGTGDSVVIYDKTATAISEHQFGSGQEIQVYFDAIDNEVFAYNGQRVYFEAADDVDLTTYVVIP